MFQSSGIKLSENPNEHKCGVEFIEALILGTAERCLKPEDRYLNEAIYYIHSLISYYVDIV